MSFHNSAALKMKRTYEHRLLWRKAAVLGSLWAASEIVLGTFLHNARIPLSGEFLTAIGIALLVAGHRLWPERGLLWRAGLVCAAMKSVSPSAVIFGPMIAISMEGFLAETGVRLLGGNFAGYLFAGGLAMTWALLQKIATILIFYGPDTVAIYVRSVKWLSAAAGIESGNLWEPFIFLLAAYFLAGLLAALAGLRAGKIDTGMDSPLRAPEETVKKEPFPRKPRRNYSSWALLFHVLLVVIVMSAGRKIPVTALCCLTAVYAFISALVYPRVLSLLKRAGIWTGVLGVSLLAGLVLGSVASGFYMALRAFVLMTGFAAIGEELLNPSIRRALEALGGGIFFETLEYAFSALPGGIASLPTGGEFARRPLASLKKVISSAPLRLHPFTEPGLFIITGGHGSGKSELVMELAKLLRAAGKRPGGICAEGFWEKGVRSGFDLIDLSDGKREPLCRRGGPDGAAGTGAFQFYGKGLDAGLAALSQSVLEGADAVFIDEIGYLELEGKGWAGPLDTLAKKRSCPLTIVIREYLLEKVRARWELDGAVVWETGKTSAQTAFEQLTASEHSKL